MNNILVIHWIKFKNRQAYYEFFIDTKYEAGMVLLGTEIKSLREGKISFNDSFCLFTDLTIQLEDDHVSLHRQ